MAVVEERATSYLGAYEEHKWMQINQLMSAARGAGAQARGPVHTGQMPSRY